MAIVTTVARLTHPGGAMSYAAASSSFIVEDPEANISAPASITDSGSATRGWTSKEQQQQQQQQQQKQQQRQQRQQAKRLPSSRAIPTPSSGGTSWLPKKTLLILRAGTQESASSSPYPYPNTATEATSGVDVKAASWLEKKPLKKPKITLKFPCSKGASPFHHDAATGPEPEAQDLDKDSGIPLMHLDATNPYLIAENVSHDAALAQLAQFRRDSWREVMRHTRGKKAALERWESPVVS